MKVVALIGIATCLYRNTSWSLVGCERSRTGHTKHLSMLTRRAWHSYMFVQEYILESRRLREEQDRAYEAPLQEKVVLSIPRLYIFTKLTRRIVHFLLQAAKRAQEEEQKQVKKVLLSNYHWIYYSR